MTGLPNRRMFNEELDRRLAEAANKGEALASFILDLDRMRVVNDTYGHETGDHLLQEIANRMRAGINAEDFVARVGGDEFGVLVSSPGSEAFIELAERLLQTIEKPIMCEGIGLVTTASIGIAVYPNDGETGNALLQSADIAMYQAKARGRNVHAFFDKTLDEAVRQRRELDLDLRCAIRNGQIVPFYQPIISFATGAIVGVETLARWQHPTKGLIGADKFISLAEDTGQVSGLFGAILKKACLDAKEWGSSITVAVNVSPVQFSDLGLVGQIFEILKETKFPIGALDLEVTESAVLDNNKAKAVLGILKRKGVRISLDDFGTGYSSLSCLNDLPFDRIKIDRSFLRTRERSSKSERLVASIITLSHTLGLTTIAEGVESAADAAWLMRNNCEFGQGYYFSPPVPADQVSDLLKTTAPWAATKLKPEGRFA